MLDPKERTLKREYLFSRATKRSPLFAQKLNYRSRPVDCCHSNIEPTYCSSIAQIMADFTCNASIQLLKPQTVTEFLSQSSYEKRFFNFDDLEQGLFFRSTVRFFKKFILLFVRLFDILNMNVVLLFARKTSKSSSLAL